MLAQPCQVQGPGPGGAETDNMKANQKPKGLRGLRGLKNDQSAALETMLASIFIVVLLAIVVSTLVGPVANEAERADTNANVSDSAVAILDLNPLFLALLVLAAAGVAVIAAFKSV